ncbi:MAG: ribonucleoside hydrolase RihC [Candidatus Nitrosocaldaceae archaeon]|nr:MAG: ribonucleoside hydrolase RihC [Candidatus Nitrosocaldaceae archaeon]
MIVLDMDPGIDDAIALIIALRASDVRAVSTVCGNVDVIQASRNALKIIRYLGYDMPVYIGASKPLKREPLYAKDIHGSDGLGDIKLDDIKEDALPIKDIYKADAVIATGPLTNIANSIDRLDARLYIMGGIYNNKQIGNVTNDAEFNFYVDPEAADIVLNNTILTACGLDLTTNRLCAIDNDMLDKIYNINNKYARLIYRLLRYPLKKFKYFNIHDLFALFSYLEPDMFEKKRFNVRIDPDNRGKCIVEEDKDGNVDACIDVDHEAFNKLFLELIR